jgi:hypothetical protein
MNALGAVDTEAINLNPNFNHGLCAITAITNSVDFFQSFLTTVSTDDPLGYPVIQGVYPNPASSFVDIDWDEAKSGCNYSIIDAKGRNVKEGKSDSNRIPVFDLASGMYTIICKAGESTRLARVIHP